MNIKNELLGYQQDAGFEPFIFYIKIISHLFEFVNMFLQSVQKDIDKIKL